MAFDHQNSVPYSLRPLNIVRTVPEDPCIVPVTSSGRPIEGFFASPTFDGTDTSPNYTQTMYYPLPMPGLGFVGRGLPGSVANLHMAAPVLVPACLSGVGGWGPCVPPPQNPNVSAACVINSACVTSPNPSVTPRVGCNASDQASEEGNDSVSSRKVKFLCSFGGELLPRPSDGAFRYVGGHTRIISVKRDASFAEFVQKMVDIYGQNVAIKYQLPEEDLDALVSISCSEDLDNMMEEYENLLDRSTDGSAKLRVFLFSSSEVVSAGLVPIEAWHASGQKFVDVVNGFTDGTGSVRTTRKETALNDSPTRGSDINKAEVVNSLARVQMEDNVPNSTGVPSPRENSTVPEEAAATMPSVAASPNPPDSSASFAGVPIGYSCLPPFTIDTSATPNSFPSANSGQPPLSATVDSFDAPLHSVVGNYGYPSVSTRAENELCNSAPVTTEQNQVGFDLQQPGTAVTSVSTYLQGYVSPHHETVSCVDYVQPPGQFGFPGQLFGTVAPMFNPHHMPTGSALQQFFPAGHMTMFPTSHVSMNSNLVQPIMPQQVRFEHYPVENSVVQRVPHFPTDHGYNAYCTRFPAATLGGVYEWHRVPQTEHMRFSEGFAPHQPATAPVKVSKFDDCFMCQKALPHAHSDSLALDKESHAITLPESQPTYYSLRSDVEGRPIDNILTGGAVGEASSEQTVAGSQTQVLGHVNQNNGNAQSVAKGLANNDQGPYEIQSTNFQKTENLDHHRVPIPQGLVGITGGLQPPYGVIVGTGPQSFHDNVIHPPVNPTQYQFKHDDMISKPSIGHADGPEGMVLKTSGHLVDESPEDYSGKLSTTTAAEDKIRSNAAYDHLRPNDGRLENLRGHPSVVPFTTEENKPPANPQVINGEAYSDSVFNRHKIVLDTNDFNVNEAVTSSSSQYLRPAQTYEMPQPPEFVDAGLVAQSKFGVVPEVTSSNFGFTDVDSTRSAERIPPIGEWKVNAAIHPNNVSSGAESVSSNGKVSSLTPPHMVGDLQDNSNSLFSNQDFWNLHETHFPPPVPSKIQIKKENSGAGDPFNDNRLEKNGDFLMGCNMGFGTDLHLVPGNSQPAGSAEEHIKQQLQAVAEDVASSVLQSSLSSHPDLHGLGRSGSPSTSQNNVDVHTTDHDKDRIDASDSASLQDLRPRLADKTNIGFPLSDGLGRLQIIKNSDLEELQELGSGTFGTVYHGKWRGTDVAIKRINDRCFVGKPSEQEKMRDDFWNEAIKLGDLHHPNVVAFYGVVLDGPGHSVATVTEYMTDGSLRSALQISERILDKRKRLLISMDVAFGMEYLHGKNIVHFDLKSDNLLVNLRDPHRPICKVADLGLSKVKCHTLISGGVRGTLPWMAPELLYGSSSLVSDKVDVYSFGIVMWELLTREEPYADLHYGAIIGGIVSNSLRPPVPEGCDLEWSSLMQQCWSAEPSERPSFSVIANELRSMASRIPPKAQNHQAAAAAAAAAAAKQPPIKRLEESFS